jgi:hypothetical protein
VRLRVSGIPEGQILIRPICLALLSQVPGYFPASQTFQDMETCYNTLDTNENVLERESGAVDLPNNLSTGARTGVR